MPAMAQTVLDRVDPAQAERRVDRVNTPRDLGPPLLQRDNIARPKSELTVRVGGVRILGLKSLAQADFADIVTDYLGKTLTMTELGELTDRVARRARDRGFVFAKAWIEPQQVMAGLIDIKIDEGAIDDIRLAGTSNRSVRAALAPLVTGRPVTMAEIERRLLIAGDIDGIELGNVRLVREGDRHILMVDVARDRVSGWVSLDNDGNRPIGPVQAVATVNFNGLLGDDDALRLTAFNTVFNPQELVFGRLRYVKRITSDGAELSLTGTYSASNSGSYFERLDIDGQSWFVSAGLSQPLLRRRAASVWLFASVDVRDVRQQRSEVPVRHDRLAVARIGASANAAALGGRVRGNFTVSHGLDAFGSTGPSNPLASRLDADENFTSVVGLLDWTSPHFANFSVNLAALGQLASDPLLFSEEIGLGGRRFVRGYDYSERSGDQGAMLSGELRYDWKGLFATGRGAQLYVFADGGQVSNLSGGFGNGSLFSTGGGIRADLLRRLNASLEIAVPLSGERFDTGDSAPRIRFAISSNF